MFPAGLEPATFRVLGGRDNHYTTETWLNRSDWDFLVIFCSENIKQGHRHHLTYFYACWINADEAPLTNIKVELQKPETPDEQKSFKYRGGLKTSMFPW